MGQLKLWLTVTNVRLSAGERSDGCFARVKVQVQGDAGEAADRGPTWLDCGECKPLPKEGDRAPKPDEGEPPSSNAGKTPPITADKLYDRVLDALQNNRKVRGLVTCGTEGLYVSEIDVQYQ